MPDRNRFRRHIHSGYEILYFLRGDAEYVIESAVYRLRPRDLLFIQPRTFHNLRPLSNTVYERFCVNFPESRIPEVLLPATGQFREIYRIPGESSVALFFEKWAEAERQFSAEELQVCLESQIPALLLWLRYLPTGSAVQPIRENRTLESILRYIDGHPTENINAQSLSAAFYMSPSWIVHAFRRTLGISLMQYISKKKILYAESLLREGLSPTEAAKRCCYESYSTFYRQYKKVLGHSPQEDAYGVGPGT